VFDSTPLPDGDRAWAGTMQGELVGVDLAAGQIVRRVSLGGWIVADPVRCGRHVVAASTTGVVVSVPRGTH
jgi:hypothetical protein